MWAYSCSQRFAFSILLEGQLPDVFLRTAIIWTAAQGYLYGIAVPFWYAAGCSIQIALMTVLAIQAKVKVPYGFLPPSDLTIGVYD